MLSDGLGELPVRLTGGAVAIVRTALELAVEPNPLVTTTE